MPIIPNSSSISPAPGRLTTSSESPSSPGRSPENRVKLEYEVVPLHTKHRFTIARAGHTERYAVWVRLSEEDGPSGWGEADPSPYYGETADTVRAALEGCRRVLEVARDPFALQEIEAACLADLGGAASARAAIISALYDLMGKRLGAPVHRLLGLDPSRAPWTSFTIGIDESEVVRQKVREAVVDEFPILKVKVGTDLDEEILSIVREEAPDVRLRVDANTVWNPKQAVSRIEALESFELEFVEQPVAAHDIDGLRFVRERSPVPIIADESCVRATDIPRLVGAVDGINIKLAKCGGISEALRMIHTARSHSLSVMLGCMVETSLGIAAAAQLAPLVDYADLDGAALLADDPFSGISIARGRVHLSAEPGLGVFRR
ncbi:MAG: dipeptide epimerase [Gemmatimonadota bacterium]|nr:MAG: dipeptide epimerase [Gemmatimonadota bacterium]